MVREINMEPQSLATWGPQSGERSIWQNTPNPLGVLVVERNQYGDMTSSFSGSA